MSYRVPVLEKFSWQEPVIAIQNAPPETPVKGQRYVVGVGETDWENQNGKVAWYTGAAWSFDSPQEGWRLYDKATDRFYTYGATGWSDKTTIGDLEITGDISTPNASDWDLKDNDASALSFDAPGKTGMLNFDTTDDAEKVSTSADFAVAGVTTLSGDIALPNAIDVDLKDNDTAALSFDSDGQAGILSIDTSDGAETVRMSKHCVIEGDLTVNGNTTTVSSTELVVEDKLFTVNKGGAAASAGGAGMEIEEDGAVSGYIKASADRAAYELKAPGAAGVLTLDIDATATIKVEANLDVEAASKINQDVTTDASPLFATVKVSDTTSNQNLTLKWDEADTANRILNLKLAGANRTLTLNEDFTIADGYAGSLGFSASGKTLTVEDNAIVDQDLTKDTAPEFAGIVLKGDVDLSYGLDVDLKDNDASALSFDAPGAAGMLEFDTTDDSERVKMSKALYVAGQIETDSAILLQSGATIDNSTAGTVTFNDGTTTVTVGQARDAYDRRAVYDSDLGVLMFDNV